MGTLTEYKEFITIHGANYFKWNPTTTEECFRKFTKEEIKDYRRIINNILSKRYRIKKKLKSWKETWFTTLTFNEEKIKLSERTIYDKIREIFKGSNWIANEDYGKRTHRLHYHVLCDEHKDLKKWEKYGFTFQTKVRYNCNDEKRIVEYMTKLSNHTIKEGTGKIYYGHRTKRKKETTNSEDN